MATAEEETFIVELEWFPATPILVRMVNTYAVMANRARQARRRVWRHWTNVLGVEEMSKKRVLWAGKASTFVKRRTTEFITSRILALGEERVRKRK